MFFVVKLILCCVGSVCMYAYFANNGRSYFFTPEMMDLIREATLERGDGQEMEDM